jgi:quercetin dioxygenase-like cupin family protein
MPPSLAERRFIDTAGQWAGWAGWIENPAGDISQWHEHPASDTYVYIVHGSLTVEFGPSAESVSAHAGDLVMIPSQTVHRELTGAASHLQAVVIRVGREPESVDAPAPRPE